MKLALHLKRLIVLTAALTASLMAIKPASATDAVACDTTCESGNRLISYADGNSVTCACVAESQMEPTVPDPEVVEGTTTQDVE